MRLNELKTRGHALPVRFVRDNARARLLLAGEHKAGEEIGIAYTGAWSYPYSADGYVLRFSAFSM